MVNDHQGRCALAVAAADDAGLAPLCDEMVAAIAEHNGGVEVAGAMALASACRAGSEPAVEAAALAAHARARAHDPP